MCSQRLLLALVVSACCAVAQAELRTDIEFARVGNESLKLDASIPDGRGPFPTAIIVHGGAWRAGDKQFSGVKPLFEPLSKAGFAWFTINYRLAPKRRAPGSAEDAGTSTRTNYLAAQVEDVETAVRWVKSHAGEYKVDTKRMVLIGESAGAHLVAMVAVQNKAATRVAAVVPFYGPFDLQAMAEAARQVAPSASRVFADLVGAVGMDDDSYCALIRNASPINHVRKGLPPFLLIHGTADKTVPYSQSRKMCEKIRSAGGACEVFAVEDADHGIGKWETDPAFQAYKAKMIDWLRVTLRTK